MRSVLPLLCAAASASAQPSFVDDAPTQGWSHDYTGGWEHFVGGGVAVMDCDGDTRPDLFLAGGADPATLARNRSEPGGALLFEAEPTGIVGVTGAWPLDIDADGHIDLAVMRAGENILLEGDADCGFAPAPWTFDTADRWSTAFSATWEGNGFPTLAIGNYVDRSDPDGPFGTCDSNFLYRPDAEGWAAPLQLDPGFCPLSMLISDPVRSGTPMLRLSNDRHYYVREGAEQMWTLEAEPRLLTEADGWQRHMLWGMGIASRDLDGDGTQEIMLTSMGDQRLQINEGGARWGDAPFATGTASQRPYTGGDGRPSTGWHAEFGDIDNDGRDDLFIAKGNVDQMPDAAMRDPNNLLMGRDDGTFAEQGESAGLASMARGRGAALADLNADGMLDIVVVNRRAPVELYRNTSVGTGHWLAVDPRQPGGNARAVGGWIELRTPGRTYWREITVGGGHGGGQALPHHFGLGRHEAAEMRMHWPDGAISDWRELSSGAVHRITR
ncbi:CRTAC1 family protein [Roseobacter sp. HKCCA0434]|uniref:CRTAC1 family protein n=1 Tax=Roseobacter sp. HKCCA0434 TaxID=3079297 RepID=UPI002905C9D8|nr:CRTAC1 family protein [Roseobacter sp. HKCCA0434]